MMKLISKTVVLAGLVALSACGGAAEQNVAANNTAGDELYNLAPDDLAGNEVLANETLGNEAVGNEAAPGNEVAENASGNAQ
jgi:hypothetical protein